jgi:hypothetical protein
MLLLQVQEYIYIYSYATMSHEIKIFLYFISYLLFFEFNRLIQSIQSDIHIKICLETFIIFF